MGNSILEYNIIIYLSKGIINIAVAAFGVAVYELIYLNVPFMCVGHTKENERGFDLLNSK